MALSVLKLGIVALWQAPCGEWAHESLRPVAVFPAAPELEPWSPLERTIGTGALFYAGEAELELHSAALAHYRDNLRSHTPSLWIATEPEGLRWRVRCVTADPYEGEALIETGAGRVDSVAMPSAICGQVASFIETFQIAGAFGTRERHR